MPLRHMPRPPAASAFAAACALVAAAGAVPRAPRGGQRTAEDPEGKGCTFGRYKTHVISLFAEGKWDAAWNESGMDMNGSDEAWDRLSLFGCNVPKTPWSWVERTMRLNHTKIHTYNFEGSYMWEYYRQVLPPWLWVVYSGMRPGWLSVLPGSEEARMRNWVIDFAKANFTDRDILKVSDADKNYKVLGKFDVSGEGKWYDGRAARQRTGDYIYGPAFWKYIMTYDEPYYLDMAQSNFTLCPGGDDAWSMRFYEAIMAGSIPVIKSRKTDIGYPSMWTLWEIPYKYYVLDDGDELVFRQDWVEENLALFIKYQTFHEGDNVPPRSD